MRSASIYTIVGLTMLALTPALAQAHGAGAAVIGRQHGATETQTNTPSGQIRGRLQIDSSDFDPAKRGSPAPCTQAWSVFSASNQR